MKRKQLQIILAATLTTLVSVAFAQGRHDEKPHGLMSPGASKQTERKSPPMTGGRHDEKPHGMTKKSKPARSGTADKKPKH